jgi:TRAP-type mannitol/chloroaromatic compound transport system substrate-binding protein
MTDTLRTPEYWEQKRKERNQANLDAFNALQDDQQAAIRQAFKALSAAQDTLSECQDLWLSDIKELDRAYWQMRHNFLAVFDPQNVDL